MCIIISWQWRKIPPWERKRLVACGRSVSPLGRLIASGRDFSFSLKVGEVFEMSLVTSDSKTKPKCHWKRNPSPEAKTTRKRIH